MKSRYLVFKMPNFNCKSFLFGIMQFESDTYLAFVTPCTLHIRFTNTKSRLMVTMARSYSVTCTFLNVNKSNTECGIIRMTNAIYMGSHSLLVSKAIPKCEVNLKSRFKISRSQAISCIGYNVNLQIAVAAILFFVECPKSIASEVLVVLRPHQNVKSIRQAVFKISCSQAISCIGYNVNLQTAVAAIMVFIECP